ncbi:MAG: hypothetical protein JJE29_02695 [Peptostreptococcaceae bacterium]|nr:hypothetical protein [Peptostreptococcaceae bacterium]
MAKIEYRKNSLDKLSSPDKLDEAIKVVTPKLWIMLAGIFILLCTFAVWGIYGEIDENTLLKINCHSFDSPQR